MEAQTACDGYRPRAIGFRAIAEVAVAIGAPAVAAVVGGYAAGVGEARADLIERQRLSGTRGERGRGLWSGR